VRRRPVRRNIEHAPGGPRDPELLVPETHGATAARRQEEERAVRIFWAMDSGHASLPLAPRPVSTSEDPLLLFLTLSRRCYSVVFCSQGRELLSSSSNLPRPTPNRTAGPVLLPYLIMQTAAVRPFPTIPNPIRRDAPATSTSRTRGCMILICHPAPGFQPIRPLP
jgi:hypothetical protein